MLEKNGIAAKPSLLERSIRKVQRLAASDRKAAALESQIQSLQSQLSDLSEKIYWRDSLFYKAFAVSGLYGDALEFGVWRGGTLATAYWNARRHFDIFASGAWDHSMQPGRKEQTLRSYHEMRFIGFDSFCGIPPLTEVDAKIPVFPEGSYNASEEEALQTLRANNVDLSKVILVKGYFEETCTATRAEKLGLKSLSVVHIDSDLYSSAATALEFCTPYLRDGSVIIFDEWFQFSGRPDLGEQRAFSEWQSRHPEIAAAELDREGNGRIAFVITRR